MGAIEMPQIVSPDSLAALAWRLAALHPRLSEFIEGLRPSLGAYAQLVIRRLDDAAQTLESVADIGIPERENRRMVFSHESWATLLELLGRDGIWAGGQAELRSRCPGLAPTAWRGPLALAGLRPGAIAIESGSDHIRNTIMGKRLSREKIFEVIALARSYPRLYFKAYFIIGMPEDTRDTLQQTYDMIREIEIDDPYVTNLIPFPGTRVFEQARRDNLFVEDFDFQNLWRMDGFHYHDNRRFYIRPYQLRLEELQEFRRAFDRLLLENRAARRRERAAALEARCSPPAAFADLG